MCRNTLLKFTDKHDGSYPIPIFNMPFLGNQALVERVNLTMLPVWMLQIRTVKVSNLSLSASERDVKEFFSFSGDIEHVELRR